MVDQKFTRLHKLRGVNPLKKVRASVASTAPKGGCQKEVNCKLKNS